MCEIQAMARHVVGTPKAGRYQSRGVLAGAYKGKDTDDRVCRTHWYDVGEDGVWYAPKTLCGRIVAGRLCDMAEKEPATCPLCRERFARRAAKGLAIAEVPYASSDAAPSRSR